MTIILNEIKNIIERESGVSLNNRSRKRSVVECRFIYYKMVRKHLNMSLSEIGATLGYDHATVLHSLRQVDNLLEYDSFFSEKFLNFEKLIDEKLGVLGNPYDKYFGNEDRLQIEVISWINLQYPEAFVVHIPNEGRRSTFERYKFKQLGGVAGMPDLMIFNPNKKYNGLAIELKAGSNKPTNNQLACLKKLQENNWEAFWSADFTYIQQRINSYFKNINVSD